RGLYSSLGYPVADFADDQLITWLQVAFGNFRVSVVIETELNRDGCRPSLAQDPNLRPAVQRRPSAGAAARSRVASGRIAQRLIRRTEDIVASVDHDFDRRRHARLEQ